MRTLAAIFLLGALTVQAQVGSFNIAKEQARRASAANTAEQQRIANATTEPARPNTAVAAAPADPVREATLKNITNLQADFTAFNKSTGPPVDAAQKAALLNDLSAAALGKKPASASVQKLAGHLITATSGKKNAAPQILARNVHALFNSRHLAAAQQTALLEEVKKNLTAAGASASEVGDVLDDLKVIIEETK
jgi:hypothetical protein